MHLLSIESAKLAVIGLGYVGLPLAVEFGRHYPVVGFDIKRRRIDRLRSGHDTTLEVEDQEIASADKLTFTNELNKIANCNVFIVTVPTPIDRYKRPDLQPLMRASESVGSILKRGDVVIYESMVYPGATEEECVPVLERVSGLHFNKDFYAGYSPERINPGDKAHRLTAITKVTSGSTPCVANFIDELYATIIKAGTHRATSIRVAEAAKVIENTQRDLNIALINELAIIFNRLGIDTESALKAAGTKWNFLPFSPGLVGGHCIWVDPYYLTHKAESAGYHPAIILAGRRLNDSMGSYVAGEMIKAMVKKDIKIAKAPVLIMGLTFKENYPDLRNSRVIDVIKQPQENGLQVGVHDPWVDKNEAAEEYGIDLIETPEKGGFDGIILAVAHDQYRDVGENAIRAFDRPEQAGGHVLYDLMYILSAKESNLRL